MARKQEPYYRISEAARLANVPVQTLYTLIWRGLIPVYGRKRLYRVQLSDVLPEIPQRELVRAHATRKKDRFGTSIKTTNAELPRTRIALEESE